jgi:2-methylisocitrate lyase-like PEP mutase family enzyme
MELTTSSYNSVMRQAEQAEYLRDLLKPGDPLLLVNAWDAASARVMVLAGAQAVATTSAGIAFTLGYPDEQRITRQEMIGALDVIARAVDVPIIADVEAGYGDTPTDVARTARGVVKAGGVGLHISDTAEIGGGLLPVDEFIPKIAAIRNVADKTDVPLVVIARVDVFIEEVGIPETRVEHAIVRGRAYLDAGADCVFVPGVVEARTIRALVNEIRGCVSVLATPHTPTVVELGRLGVAGVILGPTAYRAALSQVLRIADEIYTMGTFASLADVQISYADAQLLLSS